MLFSKIKCQKKIKYLNNNNFFQIIIIILFGIILTCVYGTKVTSVNTVWELGDEAGYLCNAAYFTGTDWSDVAKKMPYFGYGYSALLIPLFFICKNSINLIHGAIIFNIICILLAYFIQIYVMSIVCDKCNRTVLAIFAFIVSLHPYLASNTLKILCEVFLTMWVWLIAYFLILSFKYRKKRFFIMLGMVTSYSFFIHTRAIVVICTMALILLSYFFMKKLSLKEMFSFGIPFLFTFAILYAIKKNIISESMHLLEGDVRTSTNLIDSKYIMLRIQWLFRDFHLYIISFCGKILYLITSTGGIILFGISECCKGIKECYIARDDNKLILYLFFGISFLTMIFACTLNGAGTADNFTYIFYSRYYEFTVMPIIFLGLYGEIYNIKKHKEYLIYISISLVSGIITQRARDVLLVSDEIHIDTARIPGFTYLISQNNNYRMFILNAILYSVLFLVIFCALKKMKYRKILIPLLVFMIMFSNSSKCMEKVLEINASFYDDIKVADYILEHEDKNEVLFVDSDFQWKHYYSRMQVLIKEKKLEILPEESADIIEEGKCYITYLTSPLGKRLESEGKLMEKGAVFGVYSN